MKKEHVISFRLSSWEKRLLEILAAAEEVPVGQLIRALLFEVLLAKEGTWGRWRQLSDNGR